MEGKGAVEPGNRSVWREQLKNEIEAAESRFSRGKDRWNLWYYIFLTLGIVLPVISALVLKSDYSPDIPGAPSRNDLGALFAAMGAVATSIMAAFNMRRRWAISRTARSRLYELKIDVLSPDADLGDISSRLKMAIEEYSQAVLEE